MKRERGTITIAAPKAVEGDHVEVLNYRRKPDGVWEDGVVCRSPRYTHYTPQKGNPGLVKRMAGHHWTYEVRLDRLSGKNPSQYGRERGGNVIILTVGDDGIEKLEP